MSTQLAVIEMVTPLFSRWLSVHSYWGLWRSSVVSCKLFYFMFLYIYVNSLRVTLFPLIEVIAVLCFFVQSFAIFC